MFARRNTSCRSSEIMFMSLFLAGERDLREWTQDRYVLKEEDKN